MSSRAFWYESRVPRRRLIAVACSVLALSMPAVALADSAGDNQYQDPFSNVPSHPKQQKKSGTTTTPAPAPTPAPSSSSSATTTPAAQDPSSKTLPRTGFPLLPVAALGAALVAAGLGLRRLASDR
jgi:hypothetical protein